MNASYSHVRGVVDTVHAGGFVMTRTVDGARVSVTVPPRLASAVSTLRKGSAIDASGLLRRNGQNLTLTVEHITTIMQRTTPGPCAADLARIGARCDITGSLGSIAYQRRLRGYEEEEEEEDES